MTALAACAAALALAACAGPGAPGETAGGRELTLLLDGPWGAEHAGIALAEERGYASGENLGLRVRRPRAAEDAARALEAEEVDAAVMSIHALGLARRRGLDLVGVAALTQRPLTGVLTVADVTSAAALEGETVALTGRPGEAAVARTVVSAAGGDPGSLNFRRALPDPAAALARAEVAAVTGIPAVLAPVWAAQGVETEAHTLADGGGPVFPELLLVAKRYTLEDAPGALRGLVATLGRGYREAQVDPESAATALTERHPGLEREPVLEAIRALAPGWTAGADYFGQLREPRLRAWARWAVEFGLLERRPAVERAFAPGLLAG